MKNSNRKHYLEEFKKEAVLLRVMEKNSSVNRISRDLGVSQSVLSRWVRQFKEEGSSVFGQEGKELKKLQAENKELKAERDILKKAVSFFVKHEG